MTSLMTNPIDHWLDLEVQIPRMPLRAEMYAAFEQAADAPTNPPHRRAIWTGVATGYAIAFGLFTREALDNARRTPGAVTVHPDEFKPSVFSDEATAWACGVLYGYYQGASEQDATACGHCGQRLVHDVDWLISCEHGEFCEDHADEWHSFTTQVGLACSYQDDRWTP